MTGKERICVLCLFSYTENLFCSMLVFKESQCLFHIFRCVDSDCFLLGMEVFSATPENTYVFEDSFHGLQAGMTSGATVIGLATTNTRKAITGKAHYIIDDFAEMTYEKLLTMQR